MEKRDIHAILFLSPHLFMTNKAIYQELESASSLIDYGKYEEAGPTLQSVFDKILKRNFFPLLERVLFLKRSVDKNMDNHEQLLIDSILLTSPYLRSGNSELRINELYAYTENAKPGTIIEFPNEYSRLLPFKCVVNYHPREVVCGAVAQVTVDFSSYFADQFLLNELSIEFLRSDGSTEVKSLGEFNLHPKASRRIPIERSLALKIDWERVSFVQYRVNQVTFRVAYQDDALLRARLDESMCRIDIEQNALTVVSAKTPIWLVLNADKENLSDVKLRISPPNGAVNGCDVLCRYGDIEIHKGEEANLGSIELGHSIRVEMIVACGAPRRCTLSFGVSFDAEISGRGEIQKSYPVTFLIPFAIMVNFYDQNMQTIPVKTTTVNRKLIREIPPIENSDFVYAETSIVNQLPAPMTIRVVETTYEIIPVGDLPMELSQGEKYTFIGKIKKVKKDRRHGLLVRYSLENHPKCMFRCPFDEIRIAHRDFEVRIEHPSIVERNKPFDVVLHIVSVSDWDQTVTVESEIVNQFMVEGHRRRHIPLWGREDKAITFRMVAFATGSAVLPQISVFSSDDATAPPAIFKSPIVVTY